MRHDYFVTLPARFFSLGKVLLAHAYNRVFYSNEQRYRRCTFRALFVRETRGCAAFYRETISPWITVSYRSNEPFLSVVVVVFTYLFFCCFLCFFFRIYASPSWIWLYLRYCAIYSRSPITYVLVGNLRPPKWLGLKFCQIQVNSEFNNCWEITPTKWNFATFQVPFH